MLINTTCKAKLHTHTAASAASRLAQDCENVSTDPGNIVTKHNIYTQQ